MGKQFKVGNVVSRDGTDEHLVLEVNEYGLILVRCMKAPSSGWCKVGETEQNIPERYSLVYESYFEALGHEPNGFDETGCEKLPSLEMPRADRFNAVPIGVAKGSTYLLPKGEAVHSRTLQHDAEKFKQSVDECIKQFTIAATKVFSDSKMMESWFGPKGK